METALVSGATGFIGRNLVRGLLDLGVKVTSIGRTDPELEDVEHIACDFASDDLMDLPHDLTSGESVFDVFYHTAWVGVNGADKKDLSLQSKNIRGTLLGVAIADLTESKLVTLGSASEFSASGLRITDDMSPAPLDIYGLSKSWSRSYELNLAQAYHVPLVQTVVGSIYGPGRGSGDALSYAINNLIKGNSPKLDSNGQQKWEFLYIDDLVSALISIGEGGEAGDNYVISSGDVRPLSEFLSVAHGHVKNSENLDIQYGDQFGGSLTMDSSRLREELGWTPSVSFEEGSRNLVDYLEKKAEENS